MKFEGVVHLDAAQHQIWEALTDPHQLVALTPGVFSAEVVEPNHEFLLQTGFQLGNRTVSHPVQLYWVNVQPLRSLTIRACMIFFGSQPFELLGEMTLTETGVAFSVDIPQTPNHIPRTLLHQVAAQTIRAFFQNLKNELERIPA